MHAPAASLAEPLAAAIAGRLAPRHWPPALVSAIRGPLRRQQHDEIRFLVAVGFAVTFVSLLVDVLVLPRALVGELIVLRLLFVVPFQVVAVALPERWLLAKKFAVGASLVAFGMVLLHASTLAPAPSDALMAMGVVMLLGAALPVLPFSRIEQIAFAATYVVANGAFLALHQREMAIVPTFVPILAIVGLFSSILARRFELLQLHNLLLVLQAELRSAALADSNARLQAISATDPLTGLANRRHAQDIFAAQFALPGQGEEGRVAVLMVDLDHFKDFNDRWGHQAGDDLLVAVADVLERVADDNGGLAARFGGEEFVLMLRFADPARSLTVAERLREAVEAIGIAHHSGEVARTTTSVGIAVHGEERPPQLAALLGRADAALYDAKRSGRNCCRLAAPPAAG